MKTYFVTYAQNATPVHEGFFAAAKHFEKENDAEILVIPGRYRNPTSQFSKRDADQEWWAEHLSPYLAGRFVSTRSKKGERLKRMKPKRRRLSRNLTVYTDVSIQPTATTPLSGFEAFVGSSSAIFGHPRRALQVVPTATRTPRVMWSTGAITVANYTDSKAGKKGAEHHVIGALIVEVDEDGTYFCRHVTAAKDGSFTDLDRRYTPQGSSKAPRALTLTLGDWHHGQEDWPVVEATRRLHDLLRPEDLVLHDFLDFRTRNHHETKSRKAQYAKRAELVETEVEGAVEGLRALSEWKGSKKRIVRSNHDEAADRWLQDFEPEKDAANAPYWHELWARSYREFERTGRWPAVFEMEARRLGLGDEFHFLKRNESLLRKGVEHGFHGDHGPNGARGTSLSFVRLGVKVTKAHDHVAFIRDGVFGVGVTAKLDQSYNHLPSSWIQAHVVEYEDGKRAVIIIVGGKFRGGLHG